MELLEKSIIELEKELESKMSCLRENIPKIDNILKNIDFYIKDNGLDLNDTNVRRLLFIANHRYYNRKKDLICILNEINKKKDNINFDTIYNTIKSTPLDSWVFSKTIEFIMKEKESQQPDSTELITYAVYLETDKYGNGFISKQYPNKVLVDNLNDAKIIKSKHELDDLIPFKKVRYLEIKKIVQNSYVFLDN